jgi:hypothetical protein
MTRQEEIINTIKVLRKEVEVLTSRLKPHATGYLHTTIDTVNDRIDELIKEVTAPFFAEDEDVYGNLEGQARLRRIQNSVAGRSNEDDYEHTKEYYDTERNKAQSMTQPHKNVYDNAANIQNMSSDGLSNRSIKQKHGRAVQTVSEMMQEELEPLPINTFE